MTDSTGALKAQYDYDAWGKPAVMTGSTSIDFGFTGHYLHQPSGMYLPLNREYRPDFGRWVSRDPIGETGGVNLYGYVSNSPTIHDDPLGLLENGNDLLDWGRTFAPLAPTIPVLLEGVPLLPIAGAAAAGAGAGYFD